MNTLTILFIIIIVFDFYDWLLKVYIVKSIDYYVYLYVSVYLHTYISLFVTQ